MELPEGLLVAVKNYLDITWEDPAGDEKLSGIIARGMKYINSVAGAELDYTVEDKPRELLFDYCRYVRSNALNEFKNNYLHELMSLQITQEVADYESLIKLSSLTIGALALEPAFSADTKVYTAYTSNAEDIITTTPAHPLANVSITNGSTAVINGTAAKWVDGDNKVTITVTNGSATTVYAVVVTKE